jgi:transcriptional regulator with XRE-family HTH domain
MLRIEKQELTGRDMTSLDELTDQTWGNEGEMDHLEGKKADPPASGLNHLTRTWRGHMKDRQQFEQTPLSVFVRDRLAELGMKQSEFCRLTGFDQGLLSKIQSSMITNLSLETVLRLAVGLSVSPQKILALIGRADLHALIRDAFPLMVLDVPTLNADDTPAPVLEINQLALQVHGLGRSLEPVIGVLSHLAIHRGEKGKGCATREYFVEPG